jgi:dephospho-CoA kinase
MAPDPPKLEPRPKDPPPPPWATDPEGLLQSVPGGVKAALTGGIASGKSTLAALLESHGARLVDFDLLAREALAPRSPTWEAALALFGPKARLDNDELDRPFLAKRIFKDPKMRLALEAIVHPFTWKRMLEELANHPAPALTIIDVPLLYEANLHSLFSPVILCFATPATQIARLTSRSPGLGGRQAKKILESQLPITEKLKRAGIVVNNDGQLPALIRQAADLYRRLTDPAGPPGACGPPLGARG